MADTELDYAVEWAQSYRDVLRDCGETWALNGRWPSVDDLGRAALRRDDDRDVYAALRELPPALGRVEFETSAVILRIRALQHAPSAEGIVHEYIRALWLSVTRLRSMDAEPKITRSDLVEALHIQGALVDRVSQLLLDEDWMFHGGSGSADGDWERDIGERTRIVASVKSVDDYLLLEGQQFWSAPRRRRIEGTALSAVAASQLSGGGLSIGDLHPVVAAAAGALLEQGHYDSAVREAVLALRGIIQSQSGRYDLDGDDLAGATLGGETPPLQIAEFSTPNGRREQAGWRMLAQGFFAAIRNPVAHRSVYTSYVEAFEVNALASMLAKAIERAGPAGGSR